MNIAFGPTVYLVGSQQFHEDEVDAFLRSNDCTSWYSPDTSESEFLCEMAGRLCYMSFSRPRPGGSKAYFEHILKSGHGSVLEHAVFNFIITGVSRSFTHELVRHRAGTAFSQLSQRFVDESDAWFVAPPALRSEIASAQSCHRGSNRHLVGVAAGRDWLEAIEVCQRAYRSLYDYLFSKFDDVPDLTLRRKRAREAARSVLPNATETKIFFTANVRALRHIIGMRGSIHADIEIREVAKELAHIMMREAPMLFQDVAVEDGEVVVGNPKV
jgi:thymidylate synthase (FAD)